MNTQPPKWAGRFLKWYCNSDLIKEIQGDAIVLYEERWKKKGKWVAQALLYLGRATVLSLV